MISRISLLKCKEGVSEEAFREGMMGGVRDVIARMPQLRKCEIDFVTDRQQRSHLGRGAIDIDGFIEMFFDSYGDMQQAMDEAGDALLAALEPLVEEPVSTLVAVKKVDTPVPPTSTARLSSACLSAIARRASMPRRSMTSGGTPIPCW